MASSGVVEHVGREGGGSSSFVCPLSGSNTTPYPYCMLEPSRPMNTKMTTPSFQQFKARALG